MSKSKTRQQKIIADLHRKLQSQSSLSHHVGEVRYAHVATPTQLKNTTTTIDYRYIRHDLLKTTIVTMVIVAAQLLLFFLLKNHMITLPMVGY